MGGLVALFRRRREEPAERVAAAPRAVPVAEPVEVDEDAEAELVAAAGVDPSVPVRLRHVLLVNDPAAAEALAAAVRAEGYDVTIDTHDGGWTWIVGAAEEAALTPEHAARARAALTALAIPHGAEYEGWQVTTV